MTPTMPHLDVHNQGYLEDPNAMLTRPDGSRLEVAMGSSGPEFFGYDTVRSLFRDKRVRPKTAQTYLDMGVSRESCIIEFLERGNFNMMPAPDHDRLRAITMKGFRPSRIKRAESMIRGIADELIDDFVERGRADLVGDFSHHLSIRSISAFIGVPREDVGRFEKATVELLLLGTVPFLPGVPRLEEALTEIYDYIRSLIARRRTERTEDFVSDLVGIQEDGEDLTEPELIWSIVFLLLAGHDTTRSQIASAARGLIEAGEWDRVAAEPELLPDVVRESMRLYPASYRFPRVVLEPLVVHGVPFEPGDLLSVNLAGAARDPRAFTEPDRFMLPRPGTQYDIGFGHGRHYCVDWALATAEITQGIGALTSRLTDLSLEAPVRYVTGGVIAGPDVLESASGPAPGAEGAQGQTGSVRWTRCSPRRRISSRPRSSSVNTQKSPRARPARIRSAATRGSIPFAAIDRRIASRWPLASERSATASAKIPVRTQPGITTETWTGTRASATSWCRVSDSATTACLLATYALWKGSVVTPPTDATFATMLGVPRSIIRGTNARTPWKTPSRLTAISRRHSSGSISQIRPPHSTPALLTNRRTLPWRAKTLSARALIAAASVTSTPVGDGPPAGGHSSPFTRHR
jgi:cytochrome P450